MKNNHVSHGFSFQTMGYIAFSAVIFVLSLLFVPLVLFFIPLIIILLALREVEKDLTVSYPKKKLPL